MRPTSDGTRSPTPSHQIGNQQAINTTVMINNIEIFLYALACFADIFVIRDSDLFLLDVTPTVALPFGTK